MARLVQDPVPDDWPNRRRASSAHPGRGSASAFPGTAQLQRLQSGYSASAGAEAGEYQWTWSFSEDTIALSAEILVADGRTLRDRYGDVETHPRNRSSADELACVTAAEADYGIC